MRIRSVSYKEKERVLMRALARARSLSRPEFVGSAIAPFVGRFGYPNVSVGVLSPAVHDDKISRYDDPKGWAKGGYGISRIASLRAGVVNSSFSSNVRNFGKLVGVAQEVALAENVVDVDVVLEKTPTPAFSSSKWSSPIGAKARVKKLSLENNAKVSSRVERVVSDDLSAGSALRILYDKGVDENRLSRMFSVGVFGKKPSLVPTRWSITATDDSISEGLLSKVRDFQVGDCRVNVGCYLGNHYLIVFLPRPWSYELFELYANPGLLEYSSDFELFSGRKSYAHNCAGGYYSVRLAILEHMCRLKRQNCVIAIRLISDDYFLPLGVWVTREAARKALEKRSVSFSDESLALEYVKKWARVKFGVDLSHILNKSVVLGQRSLRGWLG
ncbi:hypothetical protein D6825_03980 [Candidatus Woesearchaeota archaeon]|nr:MAG: hypothetical protein D6825_03980 [Candidatus Woesearchaeota archaeon]